ncbi:MULTISPECIES: globin [unclassified Micromonospora]|uniref:globin n=1 Tax=unclassified Micromonospora TaxID=2617518 RepID=UPI00259D08C1|nr:MULTISPECIES: globin [unclassified Micromonospora]MDM4778616.1 globin [Micromonospora sp. b486]
MRTTELVTCSREPSDRLGPVAVRAAVHRWLRLIAADAELAPYLIGVDRRRLAALLTARLDAALRGMGRSPDGGPADAAGPVLGGPRRSPLTGEQCWRVLDYLAAALWALDLPAATVVHAQRAVAGLLRA